MPLFRNTSLKENTILTMLANNNKSQMIPNQINQHSRNNETVSVLPLLTVTVELSEVALIVTLQLYSPAFEAVREERERVLPC